MRTRGHPRRPRGRRRRARGRRRRRTILATTAVLLVVVGGLAAVLVADVLLVRRDLAGLEDRLAHLEDRRTEGDVAAIRTAVADLRADISPAARRTRRLLWRTAEAAPTVGGWLEGTRGVVEVVDQGSRLASRALQALDPLVDDTGAIRVQTVSGRLPRDVLGAAARAGRAMDTAGLRATMRELAAVEGPLPAELETARGRVLGAGRDLSRSADRVGGVLSALPATLGAEGPRRYLLAMQNPAELRGTGGLLGFTALLTAHDGSFELSSPTSLGGRDDLGLSPEQVSGLELPDVLVRRYGLHAPVGLSSTNLDPDLPTVAPVLLDLLDAATGADVPDLDGVVLVDPVGVARVLAEIGPVDVPPATAAMAPDLPAPIPPERFADVTMTEHYAAFPGDDERRRTYLQEIATSAFTSILDGEWDGVAVAGALVEAAAGGHLAIYARDEVAQAAYARADLTGGLAPPGARDGDLLAVTANNSAGNKLDRLVTHHLTVHLELEADEDARVRRRAALALEIDNAVDPFAHGPYVAGSFPIGGVATAARTEDLGLNRTWLSFWAPASHTVTTTGPAALPGGWVLRDQRVADALVTVRPGERAGAGAAVTGPVTLRADGPRRTYVLDLRRPPKAIADVLDLRLAAPDGWEVVDARLLGGVADTGLGGALELETHAHGVSVHGLLTAALRLEVELSPPAGAAAGPGRR